MDTGSIEMKPTRRSGDKAYGFGADDDALDDDEEIIGPESREPLAWVDTRVKRQNRCFLLGITGLFLAAGIYVLGGLYSADRSAVQGDVYDARSGTLSGDFDSAKAQQVFEREQENPREWFASHGRENPFGNKNAVEQGAHVSNNARERWNQTHPGKAFPDAGIKGGRHPGALGHDGSHGGHAGQIGSDTVAGARPSSPSGSGNLDLCDHSAYADWLAATVTKADGIKYDILSQLGHDKQAFVQGLTYFNGTLWESDGLYGKSKVRILDSETAAVIKSVDMPANLFGEGMAYYDGKLYQITWKSTKGFIYDATTLETIREFTYQTTTTQGWGITHDPCKNEFIVTDGSSYLHFWDPNTLKQTRKIAVRRQNGQPADELNEIEWYRGRILANVWYEDVLLVIDPLTGTVEKEYDFSDLFPKAQRKRLGCDVFNGISVTDDPDVLYVTGKKWDRMFKVRLLV